MKKVIPALLTIAILSVIGCKSERNYSKSQNIEETIQIESIQSYINEFKKTSNKSQ